MLGVDELSGVKSTMVGSIGSVWFVDCFRGGGQVCGRVLLRVAVCWFDQCHDVVNIFICFRCADQHEQLSKHGSSPSDSFIYVQPKFSSLKPTSVGPNQQQTRPQNLWAQYGPTRAHTTSWYRYRKDRQFKLNFRFDEVGPCMRTHLIAKRLLPLIVDSWSRANNGHHFPFIHLCKN